MRKFKIMAFVFIIIMFVLSVPVGAVDTELPELDRDSVNVSKTDVYTGDIIKYSLKASDNVGIDHIDMALIHNKTRDIKYLYFEYNTETDMYEAEFEIVQNVTWGQWDIYYIKLYDVNGNSLVVYNESYAYTGVRYYDWSYQRIYNYVDPILVDGSLNVSKTVVTQNEETTISLKTSHPEGIQYVNITYIKPKTTERFTYKMNGENNEYFYTISFSEYGINGIWQIEQIEIIGVNEDYHLFRNSNGEESIFDDTIDLRAGNFETIDFIEEIQAPVLENYEIDKTKIDFLEDIKISLKASDDLSGINKFYINYTLPDGMECNFDVEADGEGYKLEFIDVGTGDYIANYIYIEDNAKNILRVDNIKRDLSFKVYSPINLKSPKIHFSYSAISSKNKFDVYAFSYPINAKEYGGIKFKSSDPSIASVFETSTGAQVTIYDKKGRAFIIAYYADRPDVYDSIPVWVNSTDTTSYINKIESEYKKIDLEVGDEIEINPKLIALNALAPIEQKQVFYISENDEVASVTRDGKVIARGLGETTVKVYAKYGSAVLEIPVEVGIFAKDIEIDTYEVNLTDEKRTYQIIANIVPNNATCKLEYESSNSQIITVDENGLITAFRNGEAVIIIKSTDGKQIKEIKVKAEGLRYDIITCTLYELSPEEFNRKEHTPNIVLEDLANEYTLVEGVDYTLEYKDNYNAGTATINIKGKGLYKGERTYKFLINPKDINKVTQEFVCEDVVYNREEVKFEPILKDGEYTLIEGIDFITVYRKYDSDPEGNWLPRELYNTEKVKDCFEYNIQIKGINNYAGEFDEDFQVSQIDITTLDWSDIPDEVIYPGVEVTYEDVVPNWYTLHYDSGDYRQYKAHNNEIFYIRLTNYKYLESIQIEIDGGWNYSGTIIKEIKIKKLFKDVSETEWYFKAVKFCYDHGMIMGTTATTFEPNAKLTRGMLVTILYRIDGKVLVYGDCTFPDVSENMYYYNAIKWASNYGIVKGYEDGKFRPNKNVSREELVVILRNYLRSRGVDTTTTTDLSVFNDGNKVSSFAQSAVEWAIANNVITGYTHDNTIKPQGTATRAETAAVLYKYFRNSDIIN